MRERLESLIDTIDTAMDEGTIRYGLEAFTRSSEFDHYAFFGFEAEGVATLHNLPDALFEIFSKEGFNEPSSLIAMGLHSGSSKTWTVDKLYAGHRTRQRYHFRQQALSFGVVSGVSIAADASFGTKLLLVLTSSNAQTGPEIVEEDILVIRLLLAIHYRLKAIAITMRMPPHSRLSPQETICLAWSVKGKYSHEIADILKVHPRTVRHYLDRVRRKLGAVTIPQAVSIAKDLGLV